MERYHINKKLIHFRKQEETKLQRQYRRKNKLENDKGIETIRTKDKAPMK